MISCYHQQNCEDYFEAGKVNHLMKMLKRIGPMIDPCGTPDFINWNKLLIPFILTDCFRFFK